jgi:hypothetical protein
LTWFFSVCKRKLFILLVAALLLVPCNTYCLVILLCLRVCHGLDGPGIESRWGRYVPHLSRPALGFTHSPVHWVTDHLPGGGGKAPGAWL